MVEGEATNGTEVGNDECVVVQDPTAADELLELPINSTENKLALTTLEHAFPGAYGLKYKNPTTGVSRCVAIDSSGTNFSPPPGGWTGKVFSVILRAAQQPQLEKQDEGNEQRKGRGGGGGGDGGGAVVSEKLKDEKAKEKEEEANDGEEDDDGGEEQEEEEAADETDGGKEKKQKESGAKKAAATTKKAGSKRARSSACSDLITLGLPYTLEEDELKDYFEKEFGPVDFYEIKRDPNGRSRGFGFVRMEDYDDQVRVLSQPNHQIGGRECQCRLPFEDRGRGRGGDDYLMTNPRLFVAKLTEDISKERLREYFLQHARRIERRCNITDCFVPRGRGFAFITFSSPKVARELMRQADFVIDGHSVAVTSAEPKSGGGYGGPGGGRYGGGGGPSPFSRRGEPSVRAAYVPPTDYDAEWQSYRRQPMMGGGGPPKYGRYDDRGDYGRDYPPVAQQQYGGNVQQPQRFDVDNYGYEESVWMTRGPVSSTSSRATAPAAANDPPPELTPEIMSAALKWMQQSGGFSAGGGRDGGQ